MPALIALSLLCLLAGCTAGPGSPPPDSEWRHTPGDIFGIELTCTRSEEFALADGTLPRDARIEATAFLEFLGEDRKTSNPCTLRLEAWKLIVPASGRVRFDRKEERGRRVTLLYARRLASGQIKLQPTESDHDPAYEGIVGLFESALPACDFSGACSSLDSRTGSVVNWNIDPKALPGNLFAVAGTISDDVSVFEPGLDPQDGPWGLPHSARWCRQRVQARISAIFDRSAGHMIRIDRTDQIDWGHEQVREYRQTWHVEAWFTRVVSVPDPELK